MKHYTTDIKDTPKKVSETNNTNNYGETISQDDSYARLIEALSNRRNDFKKNPTVTTNYKDPKDGKRKIYRTYEVLAYKNNLLTGFNGAIVRDRKTKEVILWADGSIPVKSILNIKNPIGGLLEGVLDWVINDLMGIGSGAIFPQLQNLKDFAEEYGVEKIDTGIGYSMMGVGMSALAFTKGFEKIKFKSYSGCLSYDLLHKIETTEGWGLNKLNGANLEVYTNENEPLTKLYEPVKKENKIYMLETTKNKNLKAHSIDTYISKNGTTVIYREVKSFSEANYPSWKSHPRMSIQKPSAGNGVEAGINYHIGKNTENTSSEKHVIKGAKSTKSKEIEKSKELQTQSNIENINHKTKTPEAESKTTKTKSSKEENGEGHWITTKGGKHIFIEDGVPRIRYFCYSEPMPIINTEVKEQQSSPAVVKGRREPEVIYSFAPVGYESEKDPAFEEYLKGERDNRAKAYYSGPYDAAFEAYLRGE